MTDAIEVSADHHYHFVTGRLAESAVRGIVSQAATQQGFAYSIGVMPITVAALMTPKWLRRHLDPPDEATHVIVPGFLEAGVDVIRDAVDVPVLCGPKDCRQIPEWLGQGPRQISLDEYDIEIIAEINHAPRRSVEEVVSEAISLRDQGADVIDIGADPGNRCRQIGDYVAALVDQGLRVSIDTFDPWEASRAARRGATLMLSVNRSNREAAADWGIEVVAIPDTPSDLESLRETEDYLSSRGVATRLDPILEPIGMGLAASLVRYATIRGEYPEAAMMMGIGNLTELSDVDSAGVNLMLLGLCGELKIGSVLTTQVINWARSSVRECDIGRRLIRYAVRHGIPPKRLSDQLVMLRDPKPRPFPADALASLAASLKDNNYRLFAQHDQIHLISAGLHLRDDDPYRLFDRLMERDESDNVDPGHAFYLGFEMAKAVTALTLDKQYDQDQALHWGHLTRPETHHRIARTSRHRQAPPPKSP